MAEFFYLSDLIRVLNNPAVKIQIRQLKILGSNWDRTLGLESPVEQKIIKYFERNLMMLFNCFFGDFKKHKWPEYEAVISISFVLYPKIMIKSA